MQWKHPSSPRPKKFKSFFSKESDGIYLLGQSGVIMVDYLEEGRTINGASGHCEENKWKVYSRYLAR